MGVVYPLINSVVIISTDIVTCMSLDKTGTGEHLVTGSRDTTCVIWRLKHEVRD